MIPRFSLSDLPGADIILPGLEDYAAGRLTKGSLLVRIGRPRFAAVGLLDGMPPAPALDRDAEHLLYELLCRELKRNAYPEYRSLLRLLVSFENAADHRFRRALEAASLATPV
jgi:hypothetical protein